MSLEQLRRLRLSGKRPAMVTVILGRPVGGIEDGPGIAVIRDPRKTDFSPLVGVPVHLIDVQDDPGATLAAIDALQAAQARAVGICGPAGACGVSEEHERAMARYRRTLCGK